MKDIQDRKTKRDGPEKGVENNMEYFKLVSQIGGPTAAKVVTPHLYELQQLLSKHCYNKYSTQLDEFAPVLRVDGNISYWEFEGCEKLR